MNQLQNLIQNGQWEAAYPQITEGLKEDPFHYALYHMLGEYWAFRAQKEKAYLCYEMAAFYATGGADEVFYHDAFLQYRQMAHPDAHPCSIVIISYNSAEITKLCIESIRNTCPATAYELIVIDNASTDEITDWLEMQEDIRLVKNSDNVGFAAACNQGAALATRDYEIFFLNNDTILPPNALFWLRMGLYENARTGAVGCLTNAAANNQQVNKPFQTVEEWLCYANIVNVPMDHYYEKKLWLVGFALLIRRHVLDQIGLFDLRFGKGNYEDDDLGLRITEAGYELHLCHNCFIYHFGSMGFAQGTSADYTRLLRHNHALLTEKWGFDINYYTNVRNSILSLIPDAPDQELRVLEVGCGVGATLAQLQFRWPNAIVKGIEYNPKIAALGAVSFDILEGDIETMTLPYAEASFDYIIFADVLEHLRNPQQTLKRLLPYLKPDGAILASIPNLMHVSVLLPLLQGEFQYQDAGILDRTHLRFFTLRSINDMLEALQLDIEDIRGTASPTDAVIDDMPALYATLCDQLGSSFETQSRVYQYILRARRINPA